MYWRRAVEVISQDLAYGLRMLRKRTRFTAIVILTLALGIGVNTAIFQVAYNVLLRPLPYPQAARLLSVTTFQPSKHSGDTPLSPPAIDDLRQQSHLLQSVAAFDRLRITLERRESSAEFEGSGVSGDYFSTLGVLPQKGRYITPSDMGAQVVVISDHIWKEIYGADPAVVGQSISLSSQSLSIISNRTSTSRPYTVIGIMPPSSRFAADGDFWIPMQLYLFLKTNRDFRTLPTIARMKDGASVKEVNAELQTISDRLAHTYAKSDADWILHASRLRNPLAGEIGSGLIALMLAAGFVLLLATVSVSNLIMARNWSRQKELAIRVAIGASRRRIIGQLLVESILLSGLAGVVGFGACLAAIGALAKLGATSLPSPSQLRPDWLVFTYAFATSVVTGILVGIVPAIHTTRTDIGNALKEAPKDSIIELFLRRSTASRRTMIIGEIAVAYVLVVGAFVAVRTFVKLVDTDLGFRVDHTLVASVHFSSSQCGNVEKCKGALREAVEKLQALPGVDSVAVTVSGPLSGKVFTESNLTVEGASGGVPFPVESETVSEDFFRALRISLHQGRTFTAVDTKDSTPVAVVNTSFAQKLFDGKPLNRRFSVARQVPSAPNAWVEIVGVVDDTRDLYPGELPMPAFYRPISQAGALAGTDFLLHTSVPPETLASAVREQLRSVDPRAPIARLETLEQTLGNSTAHSRFQAFLLGLFGVIGVVIALVGTYGVAAYTTSQRTKEIGIRIALGAQKNDVFRLIASESAKNVAAGVAIGAVLVGVLPRGLRVLLFEVSSVSIVLLGMVALLLALVVLAAGSIPALRAAMVNPLSALRNE